MAMELDVLAPCAAGGLIDEAIARSLQAHVVAGAANNPLTGREVARTLMARGTLYVPDFLANCGGLIHVAREWCGDRGPSEQDLIAGAMDTPRPRHRDRGRRGLDPARRGRAPGAGASRSSQVMNSASPIAGAESSFEPVATRRTFEEAVEQIADKIKAGDLHTGDRLPSERELAAQMRISRPTLREAIKALSEAGVLEVRRGQSGGIFVASELIPRELLRIAQGDPLQRDRRRAGSAPPARTESRAARGGACHRRRLRRDGADDRAPARARRIRTTS